MIVCHQSKCSEYIFQIKFSVLIQWTPCDAFLSYLSFFQSNDLMDLKCPGKGSNIVPKLAQSPDFHHCNFSPPPSPDMKILSKLYTSYLICFLPKVPLEIQLHTVGSHFFRNEHILGLSLISLSSSLPALSFIIQGVF